MRSAVIVSTARTPIGRAYRGAFNDTQSQALGGHVIGQAVQRAGIDPAEVEDVVMGAAPNRAHKASISRARQPCAPVCRTASRVGPWTANAPRA
jgi:acetyl-CoA acetyltransferase